MKKNNISPGEALMRTRLQKQLYREDAQNNNIWKRPSGKLFRFMKAVYYIVAIYSFMVYLLNEIIFLLMHGGGFVMNDAQQAFYRSNMWIVHGCFFLSVAAFASMCAKKVKTACILQLAAGALVILQMVQIFVGEYSNQVLLAVLYAVILLAVIAAAVLWCVLIFDRRRMEHAVAEEYGKIYERYCDPEYHMLTDEQLEVATLAYETALEKGEAPPESLDW